MNISYATHGQLSEMYRADAEYHEGDAYYEMCFVCNADNPEDGICEGDCKEWAAQNMTPEEIEAEKLLYLVQP